MSTSTPLSEAERQAVAQRLAQVRRRIAVSCARCGRSPAEIELIAVSKGQPVARLLAAWEAGARSFGESRVQEAAVKVPLLPEGVAWHFIGPLQTNKVKTALELFSTVHSLDRLRLAEQLQRRAGELGVMVRCFLEVNVGGESSKHGFDASSLTEALPMLAELPNLQLLGLMAVPPFTADPEEARPYLRRLRELRDQIAENPPFHFPGLLSMGMSHDFEVAIEEGATHVRVGTAIFGDRDRSPSA